MCYTFNIYRELLGRTKPCPVGVGVSHVASLPASRQTWALLWPAWLPESHLYGSLTNSTFERGCDNWNRPDDVQLQSERDPDSLIRATSAEYGLFSQKEDTNRTSVPKVVTWFQKNTLCTYWHLCGHKHIWKCNPPYTSYFEVQYLQLTSRLKILMLIEK